MDAEVSISEKFQDVTALWRQILNNEVDFVDLPLADLITYLKNTLEKNGNLHDGLIAINCLSLLAHNNEIIKKKIIRAGIIGVLSSMIQPMSFKSNPTVGERKESLLIHEEAAQLIMKLCYFASEKLYTDFVTSSLIDSISMLCSDNYFTVHSNCCVQTDYDVNAIKNLQSTLTREIWIGRCKKSVAVKNSITAIVPELLTYDVQLFSREKNMAYEEKGSIIKNAPTNLFNKLKKDTIYSNVVVTKVIDCATFYAYIGGEKTDKAIADLESSYLEHCYDIDGLHPDDILVGMWVWIPRSETHAKRGVVLEVDSKSSTSIVFLLDYGLTIKVSTLKLGIATDSLAEIPPQISLCQIKDITKPIATSRKRLMEFCCGILCNMTSHVSSYRPLLLDLQVPKHLIRWSSSPHRNIVLNIAGCLQNMSGNAIFKSTLGYMGCCETCLDILDKYSSDEEIIILVVSCISNLISENIVNRIRVADLNGLARLVNVYHKTDNVKTQEITLRALKCLVNDPLDLLCSPFTPDLKSVKNNSTEANDCSHRLAMKTKAKKNITKEEVEEKKKEVILLSSLTLEQFHAIQTKRTSVDQNSQLSVDGNELKDEQCLTLLDIVSTRSDKRYEFIPAQNVDHMSIGDLSSCLCALLNDTKGGYVFIGVGEGGVITGVQMNRRTRDRTRLSIDSLLLRFSPRVKHQCVAVAFIPVTTNKQSKPTMLEERYVIKFSIQANSGVLYTSVGDRCYGYVNDQIKLLQGQDIRCDVVDQLELVYQNEIKVLRNAINSVRQRFNVIK